MQGTTNILVIGLVAGLAAGCNRSTPSATPEPAPAGTVPVSVLEEAQAQVKLVRADLEAERARRELLEEQLTTMTQESGELIQRLKADLDRERERAAEAEAEAAAEEKPDGVYQDEITFQSGTKIRCRVLGVQEGLLSVQLPTGEKKMARLSSVDSARIRPEAVAEQVVDEAWVPAPAPAPAPEPTIQDVPTFETDGLKLSSFWNIPVPASTQKTGDLLKLFRKYGSPQKDMTPKPGAELYEGVYYLMPMDQAVRILGLNGNAARKQLMTAGFPQKSLTYHEYEGTFEDRFDKLLLVTDFEHQVVAIQLVETQPNDVFVRQHRHAPIDSDWHLFNLVEGRTKGRSESGVNYRIKRISDDVLRVDSEYTNSNRETSECTRLFIAQPLVDLILHLIETKYS